MIRIKYPLILTAFLALFVSLFVFDSEIKLGAVCGIRLCGNVIIPSLLPAMALCSVVEKTGILSAAAKPFERAAQKIFHLPGIAVPVLIMSMTAGYPTGASICKSLYTRGELSLSDARRLSLCAVGAGPAFLVLAVGGGMFKSSRAGWLLLTSHIIATALTAVICARASDKDEHSRICGGAARGLALPDAVVEGVASAAAGIISICTFTVIFSAVSCAVSERVHNGAAVCIISALLEVSNGCVKISEYGSISAAAAAAGFGGLSVICQITAAAGEARAEMYEIFGARILHAAVSYGICRALTAIFPVTAEVSASSATAVSSATGIPFQMSALIILFCIVFLFSVYQNSEKRLVDFL